MQVAKTEDDYLQLRLYAVGEMFSLQALIVAYSTTFANLAQSLQAIEDLYTWFLAKGTTNSSGSDVRLLRQELAIELTRRKFYWTAECHRLALQRAARAQAEELEPPSPVPPPQVTLPPIEPNVSPAASPGALPVDGVTVVEERRAAVDRYLAEATAHLGRPVTRKEFWKKAGYEDSSEFQRWQRGDPRTTTTAAENFARVLKEKPHLK